MIILFFLNIIFSKLKNLIYSSYQLAKLRQAYPSCIFHNNVVVYKTVFGDFNVTFDDVVISISNIGSHTYIQKGATIINADIGKYCSIASKVSIGPGLHFMKGVSTHPSFYLKNTPLAKVYSKTDEFQSSKRTTIGNDVWIGEGAIILDGVNIGNGAIIAAGSVVTKDIDRFSIVGGTPARLIRKRFDEETIELIENHSWWNNTETWIQDNVSLFKDIEGFKNRIRSVR